MVENAVFDSIDKEAQIGNIGEYEVKLILKFSKISAGAQHYLGIDVDGNLWMCGVMHMGY